MEGQGDQEGDTRQAFVFESKSTVQAITIFDVMTKIRVIKSIYNNLPTNKKAQELSDLLRGWVGTLFENDEEWGGFILNLRALVSVANARYPKTKAFFVTALADHVSIRLEGTDKALSISVVQVSGYYKDKAGWNKNE